MGLLRKHLTPTEAKQKKHIRMMIPLLASRSPGPGLPEPVWKYLCIALIVTVVLVAVAAWCLTRRLARGRARIRSDLEETRRGLHAREEALEEADVGMRSAAGLARHAEHRRQLAASDAERCRSDLAAAEARLESERGRRAVLEEQLRFYRGEREMPHPPPTPRDRNKTHGVGGRDGELPAEGAQEGSPFGDGNGYGSSSESSASSSFSSSSSSSSSAKQPSSNLSPVTGPAHDSGTSIGPPGPVEPQFSTSRRETFSSVSTGSSQARSLWDELAEADEDDDGDGGAGELELCELRNSISLTTEGEEPVVEQARPVIIIGNAQAHAVGGGREC